MWHICAITTPPPPPHPSPLSSNDSCRWQIDVAVWSCIPVYYVMRRSDEWEWMQEWRNVPSRDLTNSPSLTQTDHIPHISASMCHLHNVNRAERTIFRGFGPAQGRLKQRWLHRIIENWRAKSGWESADVWGYNEFSMYLLTTTRLGKFYCQRQSWWVFPLLVCLSQAYSLWLIPTHNHWGNSGRIACRPGGSSRSYLWAALYQEQPAPVCP